MLHTDIQKQLQELSLEDTLALAQMALEEARKKAPSDAKAASAELSDVLDKYSVRFPKGFKFNREEANARRSARDREEAFARLVAHVKRFNFRLPPDYKFDREEANARR